MTSAPAFFSRYFTPPTSLAVTSPLPCWIFLKLKEPASRKISFFTSARTFSMALALSTRYFVGMQPTFRHVPPRCSFSNRATFSPFFAAAIPRE